MKQLLLQVRAFDEEDNAVAASGGQVVPDVGGYRAVGFIGEDAWLDARLLTLAGSALDNATDLVARFTRPTGSWDDYEGPGTAPFSGEEWSAEDKGMAPEDFLGEVAVSSVEGDVLTLAGDAPQLQSGDRVYVTAEADYAGTPGWVYAKILVDADGARGVPHYRAVDVASDNRIAPGSTASSTHLFPVQSGTLTIEATLIRRDRAAPVAEIYGWTVDDETITTTTEVVAP